MPHYPDPQRFNGRGGDLDGAMLAVTRGLSGAQRLAFSAWITTDSRAEMRHQLRIDHPAWEGWQLTREVAYWSYGSDEMDKLPAHVWRDAWLARQRREEEAASGSGVSAHQR